MAINYQDYARAYAGGIDTSPIQKGLDAWAERSREALQAKIQNFEGEQWTSMLKPYTDAAINDIGNYNFDNFKNLNFATALTDYRNAAQKLGPKAFNTMLRAGYFDPMQFKQRYQQERKMGTALLEKKIEAYQLANNIDDDEMRKWIKDKGLQTFALENFSESGLIRELAKPESDDTWTSTAGEWLGSLTEAAWKDPVKAGVIGAPSLYAGYKLGQKLLPEGLGTLGDAINKTKLATSTTVGRGARIFGGLGGRRVTGWNLDKAKPMLAKLETQLKSMYKANGGPGANSSRAHQIKRKIKAIQGYISQGEKLTKAAGLTQAATTGGKILRGAGGLGAWLAAEPLAKGTAKALGVGEKGQEVAAIGTRAALGTLVSGTQELIRRKGMQWFVTKLAQKGGAGIAARLLGKAGLGLAGGVVSGPVIGTIMAGLAINDIRLLGKAIIEMNKEAR